MDIQEMRKIARQRMQGFCRVCPVCDGRACAGEVPGMGGLGTGAAFQENVQSLAKKRLNMRLIHELDTPSTSVSLFGLDLDIPVIAAPVGGVSFNMGGKITEKEYISSVLAGCVEKGIIGSTGDGVPDFIHEEGFAAIAELGGKGIPFIKPWEDKELFEKFEKAMKTGATICGMDIDAAGLVTLKKMGRTITPKSRNKLAEIIKEVPMKFIVKGIMTPDQAKIAVDVGAAGIVCSNHGGRVLDHTPGVADVLPAVSNAVEGQIPVLADGGVRSGADVLKMLALGADAVMIGRPFSVAAVGGLKEGVCLFLDQMKTQLVQAMVMTGTREAGKADPGILYKVPNAGC